MRGGSEKGIERETSSKAKKNVEGIERERERKKVVDKRGRTVGRRTGSRERKRERERKKKER